MVPWRGQDRSESLEDFPELQYVRNRVKEVAPIIRLVESIGIFAGGIFGILGVFLIYVGRQEAESIMSVFGTEITTNGVGVAYILIGAVTVILTVRRTSKYPSTWIR